MVRSQHSALLHSCLSNLGLFGATVVLDTRRYPVLDFAYGRIVRQMQIQGLLYIWIMKAVHPIFSEYMPFVVLAAGVSKLYTYVQNPVGKRYVSEDGRFPVVGVCKHSC